MDAFTHRLQARLGADLDDLPLPEDAPPTPDEEEVFPPDLEYDTSGPEEPAPIGDHFQAPLFEDYAAEWPADEFDGLHFDDLPANRPTLQLGHTMEHISQLRVEYTDICARLSQLDSDIRAWKGPARQAVEQEIVRMRRQVDADRPYALAIADIMDQWADADDLYSDALRMVEHARRELDFLLAATPSRDPADTDLSAAEQRIRANDDLDITSARQALAFYTSLLPADPPAVQFQQALAHAHAARLAAAEDGTIVTDRDIDLRRWEADRADLQARNALHRRQQALRRELERAERDVAAAFAAAQTSTSDTLDQLLESAHREVELLKVAGQLDAERVPLHISADQLATLDESTAAQLRVLAAQPYQLSVVRADSTNKRTAAALHTLREAAHAELRNILWLHVGADTETTRRAAELADTVTTVSRAHQQLTAQQWALPAGAIVIIDDPALADPDQLADISRAAVSAQARVVLLDPGSSHGPSQSALQLLRRSVPWGIDLGDTAPVSQDFNAEPIPAVTMADRLGRPRLSQPWQDLLRQYDAAARTVRSAQRRHVALSWQGHEVATAEATELGHGIDD